MWASWCLTEMNKSPSSPAAAGCASKAFWVSGGSWVYNISQGVWKNCQAIIMRRWWLQETQAAGENSFSSFARDSFLDFCCSSLVFFFEDVPVAFPAVCDPWDMQEWQESTWSRPECGAELAAVCAAPLCCICCFCLLQLFSMFGKIAEAYEIRSPKHKLLNVFNTRALWSDSCDTKQNQSVAGMSSCCILWKPI